MLEDPTNYNRRNGMIIPEPINNEYQTSWNSSRAEEAEGERECFRLKLPDW